MSSINREELDAVSNHISNLPSIGALYAPVLVEHLRALLAEVERLTADPLPAAACVREVERAAFQRGVAAMREAAAHTVEAKVSNPYINRRMAEEIRALPDPEDK